MNYEEVRLKKESVREQTLGRGDLESQLLDIEESASALEEERDLFHDLLLECLPFVPDIDPHGIDKRAIEQALGKDGRG